MLFPISVFSAIVKYALTSVFDMITLFFFGRAIQVQYGAKYVWALYILGALFGSMSMNYFMPYYQIIMPQVGSDPAVSAMFTFYGLFNLQQRVFLFFIPVPMWVKIVLT